MSAYPWWRGSEPLVLASRSAIRLELLARCGIPVDVITREIEERVAEAGFAEAADHARLSRYLATMKALAASVESPARLVLGADQTLMVGSRRLSKPDRSERAVEQLRFLSGKAHILTSSAVVARGGRVLFVASDDAKLRMRTLSEAFISSYLEAAGSTVLSCVGGYQFEGLGANLFEHVEGHHATILGLPLMQLLRFFREEGLLAA